jgi:hypothetical protein
MGAAFQAAKDALSAASRLAYPDPVAEVNLVTDTSSAVVGAVLQPKVAAGWQPVAFFSRKLDSAQLNYSAFDRELLAAYLGLQHFRFQLEARKFHILTDHKPLTQALHRISKPLTARQHHQLSYIAEQTSGIWPDSRMWWPMPAPGHRSRCRSLPQPVQAGTARETRLK